jgi:hypothetical protein
MRRYHTTHINGRILLVAIVESTWMDDPSLLPLPPTLGRETLVKLDRHHSIKLALNPFDLNTLGNQVTPGEPVPLFPITKLDSRVEGFENGKVPLWAITQLLLALHVLRWRRNRFESGFDQELGNLGVLEVIRDVKGRMVKVSQSVNSRGGEDN